MLLIEKRDFELFATEFEYVIQFMHEPMIIEESLLCSNGAEILPSSNVKKLHGHKTSAGFGRIIETDVVELLEKQVA